MLIQILIGVLLVKAPNRWVFSAAGVGWQYLSLLILASGVLTLLGDGALAPNVPPLL